MYYTSEEDTIIINRLIPNQGGGEMVLNGSGPVHSRNQTERWLLFNRDMMGPAENDVSLVLVWFILVKDKKKNNIRKNLYQYQGKVL